MSPSAIEQPSSKLRRIVAAATLLLLAVGGLAQDTIEREGYFEVRSAETTVLNGVHLLDARLQLVLSNAVPSPPIKF